MTDNDRFTAVFYGDLRAYEGNPLTTETPFGAPAAIGRGDSFEKVDELEAELDAQEKRLRRRNLRGVLAGFMACYAVGAGLVFWTMSAPAFSFSVVDRIRYAATWPATLLAVGNALHESARREEKI